MRPVDVASVPPGLPWLIARAHFGADLSGNAWMGTGFECSTPEWTWGLLECCAQVRTRPREQSWSPFSSARSV